MPMSSSEKEWVQKKIKKLISEGKDSKQAAAIAYDMVKRRKSEGD